MAATNEKLKVYLFFNIIGKTIKKTIEGTVITIVLSERFITFWVSLVSKYNQIKASNEVKGIETIIAANQVYFLAISDTATITIALIRVLISKYILNK